MDAELVHASELAFAAARGLSVRRCQPWLRAILIASAVVVAFGAIGLNSASASEPGRSTVEFLIQELDCHSELDRARASAQLARRVRETPLEIAPAAAAVLRGGGSRQVRGILRAYAAVEVPPPQVAAAAVAYTDDNDDGIARLALRVAGATSQMQDERLQSIWDARPALRSAILAIATRTALPATKWKERLERELVTRQGLGQPTNDVYRAIVSLGIKSPIAVREAQLVLADPQGPPNGEAMAALVFCAPTETWLPIVVEHFAAARSVPFDAAVDAVRQHGEADAIPELTRLLTDQRLGVRIGAAQSLPALGAGARAAIPAIARLLADVAPGPAGSVIRRQAPFGDAAIPFGLDALKHDDAYLRRCGADLLGEIGRSDSTVISALRSAIADPDADTQLAVLSALGTCVPRTQLAEMPEIYVMLGSKNAEARQAVRAILSRVERVSDDRLALLSVMVQRDAAGGREAADVLAALDPTPVAAIDPLLRSREPRVVGLMARALAEGPSDPIALSETLIEIVRQPGSPPAVADAVARCGPSAAMTLLSDLGPSSSPEFRAAVLRVCGQTVPATSACVATATDGLADPSAEVRRNAVRVIGRLGVPEASLAGIARLLHDPDVTVSQAARSAMTGSWDHRLGEVVALAVRDESPTALAAQKYLLGLRDRSRSALDDLIQRATELREKIDDSNR